MIFEDVASQIPGTEGGSQAQAVSIYIYIQYICACVTMCTDKLVSLCATVAPAEIFVLKQKRGVVIVI